MQQTDTTTDREGALSNLRVLEIGGRAVQHCGKLLADLGADVIKVEPPGGDPARSIGPFAGDVEDVERSLYYLNFNTNKRGIVLDLADEGDRRRLLGLVERSDIVLEDFRPGYLSEIGLGYEDLKRANPGIVLASITGFGQMGHHSQLQFSDLIANAMGGIMTVQGSPDHPPCTAPFEQAFQLSGVHGAIGALFAIYNRDFSGRGAHVEVSIQEVVAHMNFIIQRYGLDHEIPQRTGRGASAGIEAYPTKDGWAHVYSRRWEWIVSWIDNEVLREPRWNTRAYRQDHPEEAHAIIEEFTRQYTSQELMEEGQGRAIPTASLQTIEDLAKGPHMEVRGFFREMEHPVVGKYKYPGPPYVLSNTPVQLRRTAPTLGQDTEEVLQLLERKPARSGLQPARSGMAGASGESPFHGIRILDFTIAFAGPFGTRYLAELGAEVIKVESMKFATRDETSGYRAQYPGGRGGNFNEINRSKRSIALDMHFPEAQAIALEITKRSDVVINNFSPGTLKGWNLGYEELKRVKPDIIMVEMPGFGSEGPHGHYVSLGQTLTAYSGMMRLWGHPGSPENTRCKLAYPDWVGAGHAALSIMAALNYRDRTGKGQHIEVPQVEATAGMMGPGVLDYFVNGRVAEPMGNRHVTFAPYNTYPCRGDDRWCVICVETDEQWAALASALGDPDWAKESRFSTREGRKAHEEEIDQRLSEWTRERTPYQVMYLLQKAGVPAAAVQDGEDLFRDYHLRERCYPAELDQPYVGVAPQAGMTMRFEGIEGTGARSAPYLGQDNEYVYAELLGMDRDTIEDYTSRGILT